MDRHYDTQRQDANLQDKNLPETVQFNEEYEHVKPSFLTLLKKYEDMWDKHLGQINVAKHYMVLSPTDAPPIHPAPHRAGPDPQKLERENIKTMREAGLAKPAVAEGATLVESVPKKDGSLRFRDNYRRLIAVTVRDSSPVPGWMNTLIRRPKLRCLRLLTQEPGYW